MLPKGQKVEINDLAIAQLHHLHVERWLSVRLLGERYSLWECELEDQVLNFGLAREVQ